MFQTEQNQSEGDFLKQIDNFHLNTPEKPSSTQAQISQMSESESDQYFGGNSDYSLEFAILEYATLPEKRIVYEMEKSIVEYLKKLNLKMKTDPRAKQDKYFQKAKRQQRKAMTSIFIKPNEDSSPEKNKVQFSTPPVHEHRTPNSRIDINTNTIIQRRTQNTPTSSPLIKQIPKQPQKSQFYNERTSAIKIKKNQSFSSSQSRDSNGSMHLLDP